MPPLRRSLAPLLLVALASAVALRADSYPRQPGIKILNYTFDVTLGDASDALTVRDTVAIQFVSAGVRAFDLDLCQRIDTPQAPDRLNPCLVPAPRAGRGAAAAAPAPAPTSVGRGMTITAVRDDAGHDLQFEQAHDRVHITFATPSTVGQKVSVTLDYHGVPSTGIYIGNNRYGDRVFDTDNWPNKARNWLATEDHISVKATKTIAVTAPAYYQVLSNGRMTEQTDLPNNTRRTVWTESVPIPSWQFSLGVGRMAVEDFGVFKGIPLSAWVFPQNREAGFHAIDQTTADILDFYTYRFGPYAYEKLAQIEAAGGGGATEPASTIFYFGGFGASSHEIAHHWFGDAVTESDWDDVWLSEGFATYVALLYTEHTQTHDAFIAGVKRTRDSAMNYEVAHPTDTVVHNNLQNISDVFYNSAQIYQGGAMVLHMLRGVVGDNAFWTGLRLYQDRYHNGSATTADFRHAMEDACSTTADCPEDGRNLEWFFTEWLYRGDIMRLNGGWHYDDASKALIVDLDQTQKQGLYRMPIQIGYTLPPAPEGAAPAGGRAARAGSGGAGRGAAGRGGRGAAATAALPIILVDKAHTELSIPLDRAPTDVTLDPNLWVPMMQAQFAHN